MPNPHSPSIFRLGTVLAGLALFALLVFVGRAKAQVSADEPSSGRWVEVTVPVEAVNEARRAAGRPERASKAGREGVRLRYQQPVEREWTFGDAIREAPEQVSHLGRIDRPRATSDGVTVIEGLDFDDNGTLSGSYNVPADPHGAVGTNHVCHVVNVSIQCQTKEGDSVLKESLSSFFDHGDDLFDPRTVYDPREDQFVVVVLNKVDSGTASENTSELLLAVSGDGDPEGVWHTQTYEVSQLISVNDTQTECWLDYPSIGLDEDAIYVTGNYFAFDSESKSGYCDTYLTIFDKGLYTGGSSTQTYLGDPNEDFQQDIDAVLQPASIHGTDPGGDVGTWVFQYSGLSGTRSAAEYWLVSRVDDPLGSPSFTNSLVEWGDVDDTSVSSLPDAPQPSASRKIETNNRRALDAVWRNGALWGTSTVIPPEGANAEQATAFYGKVDLSTLGSPSPAASGYAGGEDVEAGAHTYYPSVAVNEAGDAAIGFSLSGPNTYAGSYLATRLAGADSLSGTRLARPGVDAYVRSLGGDGNRWGDYSATAIDPVDGSVWTINKRALSTGTCTTADGTEECGRWGVSLVQFSADLLPVEVAHFGGSVAGTAAVLTWRTSSETDNAGFEVEHRPPAESVWSTVGFVEGAGTTSRPQTYRHRVSGLDPGRHEFRLVQTDIDGSSTIAGSTTVTVSTQEEYEIRGPRPNPTTVHARLRIAVGAGQTVRVSLYNTLGQRVRVLREARVAPADPLTVRIDGADLPAGLYFVRIDGETFDTTRRMSVVH